jgi:hypothetical protein
MTAGATSRAAAAYLCADGQRRSSANSTNSKATIKETTMTRTTKLILAAGFVAVLSAPAAARIEDDESARSTYPFYGRELMQPRSVDAHAQFVNRPRNWR